MASVRELVDTFHERWLAAHPFDASYLGLAGYDDLVPDDTEAGEAARRVELESVLAYAGRFEPASLLTRTRSRSGAWSRTSARSCVSWTPG